MTKEDQQIETIDVKDEFTVCPQCGYDGGFHNIFTNYDTDGPIKWLLMCPSCKAKYDIGLRYTNPKT